MPEKKYSGHELEWDLLGYGVPREARYDGRYLNFREAMRLVREHQPEGWDPADPPAHPTSFPNDLHFAVGEEITQRLAERSDDLSPEVAATLSEALERHGLQLFNALGSHLDRLHGVDAFFDFTIPVARGAGLAGEKRITITLDLTQNPEKAERGAKANAVLYIPSFEDYTAMNPEERTNFMKRQAEGVVSSLIFELKYSHAA